MRTKKPNMLLAALLLTAPIVAMGEPHAHHEEGAPATLPAHTDGHAEEHAHGEHEDEVKLSKAAIRQHGVRIGRASKRPLNAGFTAPARAALDAEAMAHVGSAVTGRVVDIKVRQGDRVKQGDVLLVVESPELGRLQSEFLQRRVEADVAAAAVEPSKSAYERAKALFDETQGIALTEVQKREAEYRSSLGTSATTRAAADAAENALRLLGLSTADIERLGETKQIDSSFSIKAPIGGQIVTREVTLGELVSPEDDRLLTVADTSRMWVLADVPETRIPQLAVGGQADLSVAAMPGERISGEVSLIGPEVDSVTRAARVRIVVDNPAGALKPGMFATVTLSSADAGDAVLAIREEAVQTVEGRTSVFVPVQDEPNTFAPREVVVGTVVNGYVPVISGISDGDQIVISGSFILKAELAKGSAHHEH